MMKQIMINLMVIMMITMIMTKSTKMTLSMFCVYMITGCLMVTKMMMMTIIPFMMIMTIMGGLIILFLYMTTTMPSIKVKYNKLNKKSMTISMILITMMMLKMKKVNTEMIPKNIKFIEPTMEMFSKELMMQFIIMMLLILITLITSIKMCTKIKTPFRQKVNPWDK